jgi:vacuolar-type H+-ATPase subunit I/STV1
MGIADERTALLREKLDLVEKLYTNIRNQESEIIKGRTHRLDKYFEAAKPLFAGVEAVDRELERFVDSPTPQALKLGSLIDQRLREIQEVNDSAIAEADRAKKEAEQMLVIIRKSKKALKDGYSKTMSPKRTHVIDEQV